MNRVNPLFLIFVIAAEAIGQVSSVSDLFDDPQVLASEQRSAFLGVASSLKFIQSIRGSLKAGIPSVPIIFAAISVGYCDKRFPWA